MLPEGRKIIYILFVVALISWLISFKIKLFLPISIILCCIVLLLIHFFRDPQRQTLRNQQILYSPADGKVFDITETENKYCVKIFMSIFDVHVQRSPVDGVVTKIEFKKGRFYPAGRKDKSEIYNEQNLVEITNNDNEKFVVIQITGFIARRIFCWIKERQQVRQGQKIGAILLGSQVNFSFPKINYKLLVNKTQKVKAGITPIAVKIQQ
ncbi:MAG: phosphatidylserine decarboxylase [Endomicrobia bacterium]|nr:phosphatidylserine decarboxylase [Endomicrobiia bacterium]MCX7716028.1 phosphatidylserine decarboxylase [Endomicrobiia bacterium]